MVPLEAEPPDGGADEPGLAMGQVSSSGAESGDVNSNAASGASAPLAVITKLAFKDSMLELEATMRRATEASTAAATTLWQSAERKLGVEVGIDDPALRELFDLNVVAIEELCTKVRVQAETVLAAADAFGEHQLFPTAAGLRPLCPVPISEMASNGGNSGGVRGLAPIQALEAELLDADEAAVIARSRLGQRIRCEVFDVLDQRLSAHAAFRQDVRERQKWHGTAERLRRDVAWLRKGSSGSSGLRALSGRSASGTLDETEKRLHEVMQIVNKLDVQMLSRLLELEASSAHAVQQPWAALLQIQAEYFLAQQAAWAHLGDAFQEFAGSPPPSTPLPLAAPVTATSNMP